MTAELFTKANNSRTYIGEKGGIDYSINSIKQILNNSELLANANGALSNLAFNKENKKKILELDGLKVLKKSKEQFPNASDLVFQANRALNLFE